MKHYLFHLACVRAFEDGRNFIEKQTGEYHFDYGFTKDDLYNLFQKSELMDFSHTEDSTWFEFDTEYETTIGFKGTPDNRLRTFSIELKRFPCKSIPNYFVATRLIAGRPPVSE